MTERLIQQRDAAREQVRALREALERIAKERAGCTESGCDGDWDGWHSPACPVYYVKQARAALAASGEIGT